MRGAARIGILGGLLLSLVAPGGARAVEVQPKTETTVTWTDNLFSTRLDRESELTVREAPGFIVSDEGSRLQWELSYSPSYEFFTRNNDLSGWDHEAEGELRLRMTPRTTLSVSDSFKRFRSISRFNESVEIPGGVSTVAVTVRDRTNFIRNIANVSLQHLIDQRNQVWASYDHAILDFSQQRETDRTNQGASAGYNYVLDQSTRVGFLLSWRNQVLTNDLANSRSEADFYNVSLSASHAFDPTFRVNFSGGPTLVEGSAPTAPTQLVSQFLYPTTRTSGGQLAYIDPSSCPTLPDGRPYYDPVDNLCSPLFVTVGPFTGTPAIFPTVRNNPGRFNPPTIVPFQGPLANAGSSSDTTFFVNLDATKEWGHWKFRSLVQRRDDDSSGTGATSVANIGNVRVEWTPRPRWLFIWSGTYVRRESQIDSNAFRFALVPGTACLDGLVIAGIGVCTSPLPGAAQVVSAGAIAQSGKDVIDTYRTFFRAEYRMTRQLTLQGTALFADEKEKFDGRTARDYNRTTIWFGLKYEFEPFHI